MARVTATEVATIFDTDLDTSSGGPLEVWIEIATDIVDDIQAKDGSIPDSRLKNIERLVAAHLASSQDQRIDSASRETASVTYQGDTGSMNLRGTKYGQNAIQLDPTGTLSTLGKPTASLSVPDTKGISDR